MRQSFNHHLKADVLIIGGGFSGLWAAISARRFVENVLIVDKGPKDWGGLGTSSGGDFQCVQDTTVDAALDDLVYYHDGLCDQELLETILTQSFERFQHYERLGVTFSRDEKGKLKAIPQRNLTHMKMLLVRPYGTGGPSMRDALVREANRLGVRRLGRMCVNELLLDEKGEAVGAVGFHAQSGETFAFSAPAVVMATGAGGWKPSYIFMSNSTGEGAYLGYKAGAALSHNEFMHIWNVPVLFAWEGQTGLLPVGARFVNAEGVDFMKEYYSPSLGANTDTTYNCRGMAFEARAGRTPIYFDTSPISAENVELLKPVHGWAKINYDRLIADEGLDFFKEKSMWMPQIMWHSGGLATDHDYETAVPGLFAACRCRGLDPGVYMGGWALCTTAVTGYITGGNAARRAQEKGLALFNRARAAEAMARALAPLGREGFPAKDLVRETQEIVYPYEVCLIKSERSLKKALARVERAKEAFLPRLSAKTPHDLAKLQEGLSMLQAAELFVRSSLLRTETRAGHHREDYPQRDNDNWLAWIHAERGPDGEARLYKVPVPLERYRIKPYRYYMDNFTFPGSETAR